MIRLMRNLLADFGFKQDFKQEICCMTGHGGRQASEWGDLGCIPAI
jgi:hypothetical protein